MTENLRDPDRITVGDQITPLDETADVSLPAPDRPSSVRGGLLREHQPGCECLEFGCRVGQLEHDCFCGSAAQATP